MKIYFTFFLALSSLLSIQAQFDHEPTFPDLNGSALESMLVEEFKPATVLPWNMARDTFMRNIDAVNGVLEGVYSGFQVTLDPNADPTTDAFDKGINTEHSYPRSKGAFENTNAHNDMHHLFPTRDQVNSGRGNLIFAEVQDNQTDRWYINNTDRSTIPTSNIDGYSEVQFNEGFEPREQFKGDIARACFYFFTMYRTQALQGDPAFFEAQRETLCAWHFQDPVDEKEWNRNQMIATYQDDKVNPFILDCRLARLYCDDVSGSCLTVSTEENQVSNIHVFPNPAYTHLSIGAIPFESVNYVIFDASGSTRLKGQITNPNTNIDINELSSGIYYLRLISSENELIGIQKFIKL